MDTRRSWPAFALVALASAACGDGISEDLDSTVAVDASHAPDGSDARARDAAAVDARPSMDGSTALPDSGGARDARADALDAGPAVADASDARNASDASDASDSARDAQVVPLDVVPVPGCGDGVVSAGETCDIAIAAGLAGACRTSCGDGVACTTDSLAGAGTCTAMCVHTPVTTAVNGDGCCPPGFGANDDSDCPRTCGNGVLDTGETCDLTIAAGSAGACASSCDDGMVCTADALRNAGTCQALCAHSTITMFHDGDGCCPSGATHATDNDCPTTNLCGNGQIDSGEACDPGYPAASPNACPTNCNDNLACTTDTLSMGGTCLASCSHTTITAFVGGDGCCPSGATHATDADCPPSGATCGNGQIDSGEACDPGYPAASPNACPTSCNDNMVCTTDTLSMGGTCLASCSHTAITALVGGDGCCPTGATHATDSDCPVTNLCGNGQIDSGEACDPGYPAASPNRCPTNCNDNMACTTDTLSMGGTCLASCSHAAVTALVGGDGCCPTGGTIATDTDCPARCNDRVVTPPETCDDGNNTSGDGCSATCRVETATVTAFRLNMLSLRNPHGFFNVFGCLDITDLQIGNTKGLNPLINTAITTDGSSPADGNLDLSIVQLFRPLSRTATTSPIEVVFPDCTSPIASTSCTLPAAAPRIMSTATLQTSGTCVGVIAGSQQNTYMPAIDTPTGSVAAPCFSSDLGTVTFTLQGIPIQLRTTTAGAVYSGNPVTQLTHGLIRGFLTQADAHATVIPMTVGVVGGHRLDELFRGGMGNCQTGGASDLDTATINGVSTTGWWFYMNFTAVPVTYSGP